jgi:hypothetical protein
MCSPHCLQYGSPSINVNGPTTSSPQFLHTKLKNKKFLVDFLFQNSMFIVKKTLNLLLLVSNGISKEDQSFL